MSASSIILAHNHPSGDPTPSVEDKAITARLVEAGKIVAPGMLLWPCTASVPHRRGIPEEPPAPSETS